MNRSDRIILDLTLFLCGVNAGMLVASNIWNPDPWKIPTACLFVASAALNRISVYRAGRRAEGE